MSTKTKTNPLVSVLTPVFNAEKYVTKAIESILNQTFTNFEYIILDDASTDNSWNIIQYYANKDKRIKAYKNRKNLYIARSRNKLINLSKGKYIAWQDADDISMPDRLRKQVDFLNQNPKVGIVGSYLEFIDETGRTKSIRKYCTDDYSLRKNIFKYSPVSQPVAMIRRECFDKVGLYNPKYPPAEDIDMTFRMGEFWEFANIPEILLRYRDNPTSATYRRLKKIELNTIAIRLKYAKSKAYKISVLDIVYNLLELLTLFVPTKIRISMFLKIRNQRNRE